jgi:hypothetical protein
LAYGRDDWPGDEGILKSLSADKRLLDADPAFGFLPEEWLDSDLNHACTTDLVTSELPAGESLVQRRGWDTLGSYGMPPAPGSYTVQAAFSYMSRGAPPAGDEAIDAFSVDVTVAVEVVGPKIDYVSPGEAVDALLSDESFRSHLADAPRELWNGRELRFVDNTWELVLFLTASDRDVEPVEAIVATVDARSGVVLSVRREDRTSPPGG